jgi:hypothetical protein
MRKKAPDPFSATTQEPYNANLPGTTQQDSTVRPVKFRTISFSIDFKNDGLRMKPSIF